MVDTVTFEELQRRWEKALIVSEKAVADNPVVYREIKSLAGDIANKPLDIAEYVPTADKLFELLEKMCSEAHGTIFQYYYKSVSPTSIWHLKLLRVECRDLLASIEALDKWRKNKRSLKVVT